MSRRFENRTRAFLEAVHRKDVAAIEAIKTADFSWELPNGKVLDRTAAHDFQARTFKMFDRFDEFQYSIGRPQLTESGAQAVVLIRAVCLVRQPSGETHKLAQTASHEDTWVLEGSVWKLKKDRALEIGMTLDGKSADPTTGLPLERQ